jgi:hypothetical protein
VQVGRAGGHVIGLRGHPAEIDEEGEAGIGYLSRIALAPAVGRKNHGDVAGVSRTMNFVFARGFRTELAEMIQGAG